MKKPGDNLMGRPLLGSFEPVIFETHGRDDTTEVVVRPTRPSFSNQNKIERGDWLVLLVRVHRVRTAGGYDRYQWHGSARRFRAAPAEDLDLVASVEFAPSIAESYLLAWGDDVLELLSDNRKLLLPEDEQDTPAWAFRERHPSRLGSHRSEASIVGVQYDAGYVQIELSDGLKVRITPKGFREMYETLPGIMRDDESCFQWLGEPQ